MQPWVGIHMFISMFKLYLTILWASGPVESSRTRTSVVELDRIFILAAPAMNVEGGDFDSVQEAKSRRVKVSSFYLPFSMDFRMFRKSCYHGWLTGFTYFSSWRAPCIDKTIGELQTMSISSGWSPCPSIRCSGLDVTVTSSVTRTFHLRIEIEKHGHPRFGLFMCDAGGIPRSM